MDLERRMELVLDGAQEIITRDEIEGILREKETPKAYVGYEPSGYIHIGWLIITNKVKQLIEAGFEVEILLADWHAFINDKFGGDMEKIEQCGHYFIDCYRAYGFSDDIENGKLKFTWASDLADSGKYWETVLRISKASTLSRIRRAMTVMGRKEDEGELDSSKFIYPAMQAADIFQLGVDLAIGGMDQRHAHMLARDVAEKVRMKKPTALHTPLLSSLSKGGRMEMTTSTEGAPDHEKMAKLVEGRIDEMIADDALSENTRSFLQHIGSLQGEGRFRALEALLSTSKGIGGTAPRFTVLQRDESQEIVMNRDTMRELEWRRAEARKEIFRFLKMEERIYEAELKMSKSDPDSGIYLHDSEDEIRRKIKKAWCPEGHAENPIMEICRMLIFPMGKGITIPRPEKWGGPLHFEDHEELRSAFVKKEVHPADLKKAVADGIVDILEPYREYFAKNPDSLKKVKRLNRGRTR